jgi:ribonuclease BN (tRNA processing enzyme)
VLIADCSYTREEYEHKVGWGHSSFDHSLDMARRVGAGTLVCTHHEPTRSDTALETAFAEVTARQAQEPGGPKVVLAYEGLEIEV